MELGSDSCNYKQFFTFINVKKALKVIMQIVGQGFGIWEWSAYDKTLTYVSYARHNNGPPKMFTSWFQEPVNTLWYKEKKTLQIWLN